MWNAGLDEAQAEIKIAGRNINNIRYADKITVMAESEQEPEPVVLSTRRKVKHSRSHDSRCLANGFWVWVRQGCILSPCLFNLYAEYIIQNARLDEAQAGIKIAGKNINNLRYADDTTLMAESKEELKSLLIKWKRRVKKSA